jgi:glycosyltransferase involved in cell wall biosynthesis
MPGGLTVRKRKILLVSYLFPPVGGIGVQRALSLAKYLPQFGYEVHVLKATNAGGPVYDHGLMRHIPPQVKVHQALTLEVPFAVRQKLWSKLSGNGKPLGNRSGPPSAAKRLVTGAIKRILCPEPEVLWVPFALRKASAIVRRYGIECALVTVPPFSALIIGSALKRRFPNLSLVSDFRDEWLTFYLKDFEFQNTDFTRRRAEAIEREAVTRSDLVVAVNTSSRDEIRKRYPNEPEGKFAVVPNGYDPEVFAAFQPRPHSPGKMIVTHVGTVYKTASPRFYLEALDGMPEDVRNRIETRFVGRISETERAQLVGRQSDVQAVGFVAQAEALRFMEETDYLLLTMTNDISVPGKIFEYMATRKPVLAIAQPGSEVDGLLRETGAGICAPPDDLAALRAMIAKAFAAWNNGTALVNPDSGSITRYERPRLVEEYGRLMESTRP